mgnify:CR=1 FL=1
MYWFLSPHLTIFLFYHTYLPDLPVSLEFEAPSPFLCISNMYVTSSIKPISSHYFAPSFSLWAVCVDFTALSRLYRDARQAGWNFLSWAITSTTLNFAKSGLCCRVSAQLFNLSFRFSVIAFLNDDFKHLVRVFLTHATINPVSFPTICCNRWQANFNQHYKTNESIYIKQDIKTINKKITTVII